MPALPPVIYGAQTMFAGAGVASPAVTRGAVACFLDPDGNPVAVTEANPLPTTPASTGSPPAGAFVPVSALMPLPGT